MKWIHIWIILSGKKNMYQRRAEVTYAGCSSPLVCTLLYTCGVNLLMWPLSFTRSNLFFSFAVLLTSNAAGGGVALCLRLFASRTSSWSSTSKLSLILTIVPVPDKLAGWVLPHVLTAFLQFGREEVGLRWSWIEFVHHPHHRKSKSSYTPSIYTFIT